jgi:predicted NBD/HSP70 family sugar kinase
MKKLNTVISSRINRSLVLGDIHRNPMISRAQLADLSGLDRSAITQILNYLLDQGLVLEVEKGKSGRRGGRAPIHLAVNYSARTLIVAEIAPRLMRCVVTTLGGEELFRLEMPLRRREPLVEKLSEAVGEVARQQPDLFARAVLLNVVSPGVVDRERGIMILNILHNWRQIAVAEPLREKFHLPVFLENDANAAAVGELRRLSEEENFRSLIYLYLRESPVSLPVGVGGAIILDGRLWQGSHCFAGESSPTINAYLHRVFDEDEEGAKMEQDGRNLAALVRRAAEGDAVADRSLKKVARRLGDLLAELAVFVDPDAVVVAVEPANETQVFFNHMRQEYEKVCAAAPDRSVPFLAPKAGQNAALEGAVALGMERVFTRDSSQVSLLFDQSNGA